MAAHSFVSMLIMVFHASLKKSVITILVAVVLFALALSLIFQTNNRDTVIAIATYAAVLVAL